MPVRVRHRQIYIYIYIPYIYGIVSLSLSLYIYILYSIGFFNLCWMPLRLLCESTAGIYVCMYVCCLFVTLDHTDINNLYIYIYVCIAVSLTPSTKGERSR